MEKAHTDAVTAGTAVIGIADTTGMATIAARCIGERWPSRPGPFPVP